MDFSQLKIFLTGVFCGAGGVLIYLRIKSPIQNEVKIEEVDSKSIETDKNTDEIENASNTVVDEAIQKVDSDESDHDLIEETIPIEEPVATENTVREIDTIDEVSQSACEEICVILQQAILYSI